MKNLTFLDGNLLLSTKVHVIGHQANCQNVFGSGIARSIRELYPEAYAADTKMAERKLNNLGNFSLGLIPTTNGVNRHNSSIFAIYNLYGQNLGTDKTLTYTPRKTNYEALYTALDKMATDLVGASKIVDSVELPPVGFPYKMGSALGGGSWDIVQRLIEVAFADYPADVFIYKFNP